MAGVMSMPSTSFIPAPSSRATVGATSASVTASATLRARGSPRNPATPGTCMISGTRSVVS